MTIMETTEVMKYASDKIAEAISLMKEAKECVMEYEKDNYAERRGSMRMRGKYGKLSYRYGDMDDYDEELPRNRRY